MHMRCCTFPMATGREDFKDRVVEMADNSESFENMVFEYGLSQLTKKYYPKIKGGIK